eukprot:7237886-Pyramimonas_sp.AAC.1
MARSSDRAPLTKPPKDIARKACAAMPDDQLREKVSEMCKDEAGFKLSDSKDGLVEQATTADINQKRAEEDKLASEWAAELKEG